MSAELLKGLTSADIKATGNFRRVTPDNSLFDNTVTKLEQTVFGQRRAMEDVAHAINRAMAGLNSGDRPMFSGLFLGEPGVGKTETGQAVANLLYDDPQKAKEHVLVIDSANFSEKHMVTRLVGAPPSYVGYGDKPVITPEFLKDPNVIVVDEVEKGVAEYHKFWLSILDKGKTTVPIGEKTYTNVKNTELDFINSIIIFTSNIGSGEIRSAKAGKHLGFDAPSKADPTRQRELGIQAFRDYFKYMPEFPNRLDSVVVFDSLTPQVYELLVDKFLQTVNENQRRGNNFLALTREAKEYVVDTTDKHFGGRELRRTLEREIISPAADVKLMLPDGVPIVADIEVNEETGERKVIFWAPEVFEQPQPSREIIIFEEAKKKRQIGDNPTPTDGGDTGGSEGEEDSELPGTARRPAEDEGTGDGPRDPIDDDSMFVPK